MESNGFNFIDVYLDLVHVLIFDRMTSTDSCFSIRVYCKFAIRDMNIF